ncbi:prepilin-type N-terminal cleavage/methylation domain-containing protein [Cerasicoccus fimbriatus]|uniref:prepilin-type N-terminal cleavage/methylation domain-containing protein n=1 Tax=Cerasicoccus fimbriatus TaxID=3014554 RepID=UPI0022B3803D|nr:prepilin-type N-terminal cleavage/methylation domain-containing protein [Cerasicoccus sp. TK19100]
MKNYIISTNMPQRRSPGLSLIEIMVGMTILGLVMGASILALPEIRQLNFTSDSVRSGYTVLNSELENLRTQTFDQLAQEITSSGSSQSGSGGGLFGGLGGLLGIGEEESPTEVKSNSTATVNNVDYAVTRQLEFTDSSQEIIQSTVSINWSVKNRPHSIVGRAIFTKDGLSDKKFSSAN